MKLAERHRLTPRKKKKEEDVTQEEVAETKPKSVKLRRKGSSSDPSVHYISKSVYSDRSTSSDESAEDFLKRINEEFSLKVVDDADEILGEIFKRGWKVPHIELSIGRLYLIRFFRDVGGNKSRPVQKKDKSLKKLLLKALDYILREENDRYKNRMDKARRGRNKR